MKKTIDSKTNYEADKDITAIFFDNDKLNSKGVLLVVCLSVAIANYFINYLFKEHRE